MSQFIAALLGLHGPGVYAVITALVLLEAAAFVGLVVPGETALLVGGVLASRGNLSLPVLLPLVACAAVAGDSLGYAIGYRVGPAVESGRAGRWIGAPRWARVHAYVTRRGAWAVVLGRWVGVLRALVPAVAGMTRMPYRRFLVANVVGGLTWVGVVTGLGYFAGGAITTAQTALGRLSVAGAVVLLLLLGGAFVEIRHLRPEMITNQGAVQDGPAGAESSSLGRLPGPPAALTPRAVPAASQTPTPTRPALPRWWLSAGVAALATLGAIALLDGVREHADLAAYDALVSAQAVALRNAPLTDLAQATTFLGSTISIGVLTMLAMAWSGWRRRWATTGLIAATMAVSAALTLVLKQTVGRSRPPAHFVLGPIDHGYAFPSGHTLNSTVFFGLLAAIALARLRSPAARTGTVVVWLSASAAVGLSRIYLGYHWLTDVMAGWTIGAGLLACAALAWTLLTRRRQSRGGVKTPHRLQLG